MKHLGNENFISYGQIFLVRCPKCQRENYIPNVASGICTWCGLDGHDYYKKEIKNSKNT